MGMLSQAHLDAINGASAELVRLEVDLNDSPESTKNTYVDFVQL